VVGDEQKHTQQQEHEHAFEQEREAGQEVDGAAVDERKQQTSDEVGDGFAARQQRERLAELVFTDEFTDERLGAGNDEGTRTSDDDGQVDQPAVLTVGYYQLYLVCCTARRTVLLCTDRRRSSPDGRS